MAAYEDGSYSCLPGISLIAKVLAGRCQMHYTRASVGNGAIPDGTSPKAMTGPAGYIMDAMISAITNPVDGECQVTIQINSKDVETGFFATGILLYAEDPDEGEVPYTYLMLENEPEWIRPASSAVGKLATFELIAAVGDIDRVSASLDPNAFMTRDAVKRYLEDHEKDPGAHAVIVEALKKELQGMSKASVSRIDIVIPKSGWSNDTDTSDVFKLYTDVTVEDVTEGMIPALTILPESQKIARACGLCTTVQTLDGVLRVYAQQMPAENISGSLALFGIGGSAGTGTGTYTLQPATKDRLGGVKIGDNISVTGDGTISVDGEALIEDVTATEVDVTEMLNDVFGNKAEGSN